MRKPRYAIYDTARRRYLLRVTLPDPDSPRVMITTWTEREAQALRFPGIKSAQGMLDRLGNWNNLVIINRRGGIVG